MKKKIRIAFLLIPFFAQAQIKITITFTDTPSWNTRLIPANLKYNKWSRFGITVDDRQSTALDLLAYYTGGTSPATGQSFPGHTFTDGANVREKFIKWTGSIATNAWYNMDTTQDASVNKGTMSWLQVKQTVDANWSLLDHGAFHGIGVPGAVKLGFNNLMNAAANRNYTYRKLTALGSEYVLRFGVVPTNDPNYHSAWEQLGYIGGSSESTDDNYPNTVEAWRNFGLVNVTNWKSDNRYKVHLRRFRDLQGNGWGDARNFLEGVIALCNQTNPSINYSLEHGLHNATIDTVRKAIDSFYRNTNDKIWVCGLQEFYEYFETIQQTAISQTISGNTLTVTLDQRFLPDAQRWRDMSFLLNSNIGIKEVVVTGADDYSYNTKTGLINIYKKKTKGFAVPQYYNSTGFVFSKKLPLQLNDFYIDNNYDNKPAELIDGNMSSQFHAKAYDNPMIYTPYDVVVDLSDYGAVVKKVRIYGNGNKVATQVILTRNDNEAENLIGTFTGGSGWQDFIVSGNKYVASRLILRSNSTGGFGNELEVYADYLPYTEQTYAHRKTPLKYMLGTNAHWWNFVQNAVGSRGAIIEEKIRAFDSLHLYSLRNYGNAKEYIANNGAAWAFNPVVQGWFEDLFMRRLKQDNPELIRWSVLQGQFNHVRDTWEGPDTTWNMKGKVTSYDDKQGWGVLTINVFKASGKGWWGHWFLDGLSGRSGTQTSDSWHELPNSFPASKTFVCAAGLKYQAGDTIWARARHASQLNYLYSNNNNAGRSTLSTWDTVARLAYNWAARKGTNRNATKFIPYQPYLTGIENNNDSVGLGTSEWTEIMNEPNAWWAGYDDYLNGQHLATAWSKIYDNHKIFSATLGAKNADPNMMVSSSGLAISTVDLNRSADFWAKENRGNRPKTEVPTQPAYWRARTFGWSDNPYDVIQFHNYSFTGGSNQYAGGVNAGLPPELSHVLHAVDEFVWFRNKYAPWALVDVGEWGYDVNPNSPMNAPAIDKYNAEQVRGAWAIRTLLEYNAHGVDVAQWYRLYMDYESDSSNATQFATMSLLKYNNDGTIKRRVVGNYFRQLSDFGDYVFDTAVRNDSIHVLRFKNGSNYFYAIWSVERIRIKQGTRPVFTNRTGIYNLSLPPGSHIWLRKFQDNTIEMSDVDYAVKGNNFPVPYDLKPVFVVIKSR
jgi:hypothetical protein